MKIIIRTITFFVLVLSLCKASAQSEIDSIKFSGILHNSEHKYSFSEISISYFDFRDNYDVKRTVRRVVIDSTGHFNVSLPNMIRPYHIYLGLHSNDKTSFLNPAFSSFFIEVGDRINIDITINGVKASLNFSGKNAEKYNIVKTLETLHDQFNNDRHLIFGDFSIAFTKDSCDLDTKYKMIVELLHKYQTRQRVILANSGIKSSISTLLDQEYYNYAMSEWPFIRQLLLKRQPGMRNLINRAYLKYNSQFQPPNQVDSITAMSGYTYFKAISLKLAYEQMMLNNDSVINSVGYYSMIKNNYKGSLRDKLISNYFFYTTLSEFLSPTRFITLDSLLKDALGIVKDSVLITSLKLKRQNSAKKYNRNVINAQFEDLSGNKFEINNLRGKVILIDVWFDGCAGCAILNSNYKKDLYPKYEKDTNFVVISLNIDNNKKAWHSGIASGNYTSSEHINLNTGSSGMEHPFLKFYEVRGGPWLMLVNSDGTIRYQPSGTGPVAANVMMAQIDSALAEKHSKTKNISK